MTKLGGLIIGIRLAIPIRASSQKYIYYNDRGWEVEGGSVLVHVFSQIFFPMNPGSLNKRDL